jgi:ABC-type amino acid transport substrate-binding protein
MKHLIFLFCFYSVYCVTLKTVLVEDAPDTFFNQSGIGNSRFSGLSVDIMNMLSSRTNLTFDAYLVADKQYGAFQNGKWNGIIGEIVDKKAEISFAPLTITKSRKEAVDFIPYSNIGLQLLIKRPIATIQLDSFLKPFQPVVWFSVIGVVLLVGLLLWIYDVLSPYGFSKTDQYRNLLNFPNSLYNSGIGMTGQLGNPGRTWATRALTLGYYLFLIIVTTTYTANLTANLTTQSSLYPITKLEDAKSGISIGIVSSSAPLEYFDTHSSVGFIKQYLVIYPTFGEMLNALKVGNITTIFWDSVTLDYIVNQPSCEFLQIGPLLDPSNYGIALPKNSSFYNLIEIEILKMREDGTIDNLYSKWMRYGSCPTIDQKSTSMGMDTFGGVFIAFGILVAFCTMVIIIEVIFHLM